MIENQLSDTQLKLPNDQAIFILGIISVVTTVMGCCCGLLTFVPSIVMGIIALVMGNKAIAAYKAAPESYEPTSYKNVNTGRTLSIIALVLSGIGILLSILWLVGIMSRPEYLQQLQQQLQQLQNVKH